MLRNVISIDKSHRLSGDTYILFHLECDHLIEKKQTPRMRHPRKMRCKFCEVKKRLLARIRKEEIPSRHTHEWVE